MGIIDLFIALCLLCGAIQIMHFTLKHIVGILFACFCIFTLLSLTG